MTIRACIYKNCENYINLKDRSVNRHVTLFGFPKNPERRKLWMELGKVPPNLPPTMYYFCIDHFDRKYLSVNNVRKVLVGDAVPYPYEEQEFVQEANEDDASSNLGFFLYDLNKDSEIVERNDLQDEQHLHVESTTLTNEIQDDFQNEHYSLNLDEEKSDGDGCIIVTDEENNTQISAIISSSKKRKLDESNNIIQMQASSSKAKLLKTSPTQKSFGKSYEKLCANTLPQTTVAPITNQIVNGIETIEEDIKEEQLIDTAHVTTFIFKGEEYVQMPKDYYVKEKIELVKKLRKMESIVKTIKQQLNSLDL